METFQKGDKSFDLTKIVIEVRYEEAILFSDLTKVHNISRQLKRDFPRIQRDDNGYIFINPEEEKQVIVTANRASLIDDSPKSITSFKTQAIHAINIVTSGIEVKDFTRIGLRVFLGKNTETLVGAAVTLKNKLVNLNDHFKVAQENSKLNLSFSYEESAIHGVNINITPDSMLKYNNPSGMGFTHKDYNHLVYDFDFYTLQLVDQSSLNSFCNSAMERIEELVLKFDEWVSR